jgi:TatD DNase family protein
METPDLIDIGVNLAHRSFDRDRAEVIVRGRAAGVGTMIVTGSSLESTRAAIALAGLHDGLYATCGIHPHQARTADARALDELAQHAKHPRVVAVGECGLDFDRDFSPRPDQERAFEAQLELAARTGKPLFLHERAAHERFLAILRAHRGRIGAAVVHCFTGSAEELRAYLALDLHIGITGWICDERRGKHLHALVREIPLERLMLETDAPFLTPRTVSKGRDRNEPALLPHVLATVAACLGRPPVEIATATSRTARAFFRLPAPAR